jgi:hypothetical protein
MGVLDIALDGAVGYQPVRAADWADEQPLRIAGDSGAALHLWEEREVDSTHAPSFPGDTAAVVSSAPGEERADGDSAVPAAPLVEFTGITEAGESGLPFHFRDYLELVDWTGRAVRADKQGYIPADVPPILGRLGMEAESWVETVRNYRHHFYGFVGPADVLAQCGQAMGRSWLRGVGACRRLLGKSGAQPTHIHAHPA